MKDKYIKFPRQTKKITNLWRNIDLAYAQAILFVKNHYENFPVISFLVRKDLQKHIAIIYWFARTADDLADEGEIKSDLRLNNLNKFEEELTNLLEGKYTSEFHEALHNTIKIKKLNPTNFYNLIKAFKQDVGKKRYDTFQEVLDYCMFSANPVGRLILELYGKNSERTYYLSDKICTALQITNFIQDIRVDYKKGRIYIPVEDLVKYKLSEKSFDDGVCTDDFRDLVRFQVERTERMFDEGVSLIRYLSGFLKYEILWTVMGGKEVLRKIRAIEYDVLNNRPVLSKFRFVIILIKSMLYVRRISKTNIKEE